MVDLMTEVNFEFENEEEKSTAAAKKQRHGIRQSGGLATEGEYMF